MQFNSETNGLDLYSDCRWWCGLDETSDTTTYPIKAFTRNANKALDYLNAIALRCDGIWQFDDGNNTATELLDITTNIVSGTAKYALSVSWLKINRVRIKDANGNWVTLVQRDRRQYSDAQLNASSGTPWGYDLIGNWLYLDKAPNYNSTGGLEVQFQRGASLFVNTDTTKTPGFAVQFHTLVSMMAALDYVDMNEMESRATKLRARIGQAPDLANGIRGAGGLLEFANFYSGRDNDGPPNISVRREDYGQGGLGGWPPTGGGYNDKGFY